MSLVPTTGEDTETMAALAQLADHLSEQASSLARRIGEACQLEVPTYSDLSHDERELRRIAFEFGIKHLARIVRESQWALQEDERKVLDDIARQIAAGPEPIHVVIRYYHVALRELLATASEIAPELGTSAGVALSVTYKLAMSLVDLHVQMVEAAFAERPLTDFSDWKTEQAQALVTDLVLHSAADTYDRRARSAGMRPGPWYRAVVALADGATWPASATGVVDALAERCIVGLLGPVAIAIISSSTESNEEARAAAASIEREVSQHAGVRVTVAVGPPRNGLRAVHESYSEALAIAEAARSHGQTGLVSLVQTILPRMADRARAAGVDLVEMIQPLRDAADADELIETVRAYISVGCSVQEAAGSLFMHRNTLRRRIQHAEELLGYRIADKWAEVELALLALRTPS